MAKIEVSGESHQQLVKERIWTKDFILICVANLLFFLAFQITLPTLPLFVTYLGGNEQLIGFIIGIFTFSALIIRPFAGHALETKGRRIVFLTGLIIFILSVGSYSIATSMLFLFIMRVFQGVGWGLSTTASGTIVTDIIPASRRGEGIGYFGLSGNIALAAGPTLGLLLVNQISYFWLFIFCAGLSVLAFILATFVTYKKPTEYKTRAKWDLYEKAALDPSILTLFITATFGGIATFLPLYTVQKGVEGIHWYFVIYALALMLTRLFSGKIYDKKGHRAVFLPGTSLIIIAMLLLAWMANSFVLFLAAFLYGVGFGTVQPALQAWAVERAPKNRRGMANATFFSFFDIGIGCGAILFGQIGYWLDYSSIYVASACSVFISVLYYFVILRKEKKAGIRNMKICKSREM